MYICTKINIMYVPIVNTSNYYNRIISWLKNQLQSSDELLEKVSKGMYDNYINQSLENRIPIVTVAKNINYSYNFITNSKK